MSTNISTTKNVTASPVSARIEPLGPIPADYCRPTPSDGVHCWQDCQMCDWAVDWRQSNHNDAIVRILGKRGPAFPVDEPGGDSNPDRLVA